MAASRFRVLVQLFSRRFFENDLLAPDIDLRPSAIWLLGALMTPSLLWSAKAIVRFGLLGAEGHDVLEAASWFDKSLLVTLAIVSGGVVSLLCWEALLVDRRDALALGSLPLRRWTIVAAKGTALLRMFAVVCALHLPSTVVFSVAVYAQVGLAVFAAALAAHAVAVVGATLATCLVVTVALVGATTLFSGRAARVVTTTVQVGVLGALTTVVFTLQWTVALGSAVTSGRIDDLGWLSLWPPLWFLGLYQVLLGAEPGGPLFFALAQRAAAVLAFAVLVCAPLTLVLWDRALATLPSATASESPGRRRFAVGRTVSRLARASLDRALLQFFFAVLARSARHRLALVSAASLAAAVTLEGVLVLAGRGGTGPRWLTEFATPLLVLFVLLGVVRWLLSVPAELPARWVLAMMDPAPGCAVRRVVHRLLVALVALPAVALACVLSWWQGGVWPAGAHGVFVLLVSLLLIELSLVKVTYMPFATEYVADRSNIKARWPVHVFMLLWIVPPLTEIERALFTTPGRAATIVAAVLAAIVAVAYARRAVRPDLVTTGPGTGAEWRLVELGIGVG
jgi:hypothetical protein